MESRLYLLPEVNEYFYYKCIWAVACSDEPRRLINYLFGSFNIDSFSFLNRIDSFLDVNSYALTSDARSNISVLLSFLRNDSTNQYINSISSKLNSNVLEFIDGFIALEFEQRYMVSVGFNFTDDDHKIGNLRKLNQLFVNDLDILITHSMKCDDRTFEMKMEKYTSEYYDYIGSVNKIISERPEILKDIFFSSRVRLVCDRIDQMQKDNAMNVIYTKFKGKNNL